MEWARLVAPKKIKIQAAAKAVLGDLREVGHYPTKKLGGRMYEKLYTCRNKRKVPLRIGYEVAETRAK